PCLEASAVGGRKRDLEVQRPFHDVEVRHDDAVRADDRPRPNALTGLYSAEGILGERRAGHVHHRAGDTLDHRDDRIALYGAGKDGTWRWQSRNGERCAACTRLHRLATGASCDQEARCRGDREGGAAPAEEASCHQPPIIRTRPESSLNRYGHEQADLLATSNTSGFRLD